jgi:hypothetical protein
VQAKGRRNIQFQIILTHNLHDGVRNILKWYDLLVVAREVLFLQIYPYLITDLKIVWNLILLMSLFVLGFGFL